MNQVPDPTVVPSRGVPLSAAIVRQLLLLRQQQQGQQPRQAPAQPAT